MLLGNFKKDVRNKKDKKSRNYVKAGVYGTGATVVGVQGLRSGVPRVLGVRLEQHGTSRKSAKKILSNGGYLNPKYGGSEDGVTASMKLPKEFLERSRGNVFVSGKNVKHPNYNKRVPIVSDIGDILTRKVQVAGYRGSKAGKITDKDVERGRKFVATLADKIVPKGDPISYEAFKKDLESQSGIYRKTGKYFQLVSKEQAFRGKTEAEIEKIKKRAYLSEPEVYIANETKNTIKDIKKYGYKDPTRVKRLRKVQKQYKKLLNSLSPEEKDFIKKGKESGWEYSPSDYYGRLQDSGNKKLQRLANLGEEVNRQRSNQYIAKNIGLSAAWTQKLVESPPKGVLGVGKTLYVPGSDEFFNKNFEFDPDDPFFGLGRGNALKTTQKVKVFGNRASATNYALRKYGNGNRIKGAINLIKANPKRSAAGLAILGVAGVGATILGKKAIDNATGDIKVKSYTRKGKVVKAFNRKRSKRRSKNKGK